MSKPDMLTWTKHPRGTARQVIARRCAWTTFYALTAATFAFVIIPRYWTWHEYLTVAIVTIPTGVAARIYLRRTGGKL